MPHDDRSAPCPCIDEDATSIEDVDRAIGALLYLRGLLTEGGSAPPMPYDAMHLALLRDRTYLEARGEVRRLLDDLHGQVGPETWDLVLQLEAASNSKAVAMAEVAWEVAHGLRQVLGGDGS